MSTIIALIAAAVTFGTVLMYGTLGEVLTERSGNLNLGVEGIMFMGGAFGLGGVFYYEQAVGEANSSAAVALLIALNYMIINTVVDILYGIIDPRVRCS